jgi:2-polyprenyl-6-methoxyphenol hydroxylase-like FAD-dependent oxidoreductase
MASSRSALIIGAGIGGLAAGVALQRIGWEVRIHERAASPRELGFGLLLAPNALAALRELGVAPSIEQAGVSAAKVEMRHVDGRLLRRINTQLGGQSIVALRTVLHGALMDAVGERALVLGSEAVSATQHAGNVTLTLKNGRTETAALLVAADGVHSVIRRQLHPDEPLPRPSGFTAVRGVGHGVGDVLGDLMAAAYFGDGIESATARAGSDAVYWYLSLLSADVPAGARSAADVLGPLLPRFDSRLRSIISATTADNMRLDPLFQRDPLLTWGEGLITLLGDAAHPVMPHTGQGAALALEDAVALKLVLSATQDLEMALRRYEQVREYRTRKFINAGPRIARMTTTRNPLIKAIRTAAVKYLPESVLNSATSGLTKDPHVELRG